MKLVCPHCQNQIEIPDAVGIISAWECEACKRLFAIPFLRRLCLAWRQKRAAVFLWLLAAAGFAVSYMVWPIWPDRFIPFLVVLFFALGGVMWIVAWISEKISHSRGGPIPIPGEGPMGLPAKVFLSLMVGAALGQGAQAWVMPWWKDRQRETRRWKWAEEDFKRQIAPMLEGPLWRVFALKMRHEWDGRQKAKEEWDKEHPEEREQIERWLGELKRWLGELKGYRTLRQAVDRTGRETRKDPARVFLNASQRELLQAILEQKKPDRVFWTMRRIAPNDVGVYTPVDFYILADLYFPNVHLMEDKESFRGGIWFSLLFLYTADELGIESWDDAAGILHGMPDPELLLESDLMRK